MIELESNINFNDIAELICHRCKSSVFKSENPRYVYQCKVCDEDLYEFETEQRQPLIVEGNSKDTGFRNLKCVDEWCSHCMHTTYNIPTTHISLCAHCGEELFPCAGCEDSTDGICTWDRDNLRCNRFNHSDASKRSVRETMLIAMQKQVLRLESIGDFHRRSAQVNCKISELNSKIKKLEHTINNMEVLA
jgi:hypothetical protein